MLAVFRPSLGVWAFDRNGRTWLLSVLPSIVVFYWSAACFWRAWQRASGRLGVRMLGLFGLVVILGLYGFLSVFVLQPGWLPQQVWYDCIANRGVTERLIDPALLKVERWEIMGEEQEILFVHPSETGAATLVYPVKILPRSAFRAARRWPQRPGKPRRWSGLFSFVEDDAGIHLLYSRYVIPNTRNRIAIGCLCRWICRNSTAKWYASYWK
jgi:hypothetical protein